MRRHNNNISCGVITTTTTTIEVTCGAGTSCEDPILAGTVFLLAGPGGGGLGGLFGLGLEAAGSGMPRAVKISSSSAMASFDGRGVG